MRYDNYCRQWEQISKSFNILSKSILSTTYPINDSLIKQQEIFQRMASFIQPINTINIAQSFEPMRESVLKLTNALNTGLYSSLNQSLLQYRNLTSQFADIVKIYNFDYLKFFPENLTDKFIELSDAFIDDLVSEPSLPLEECEDSFESIKSVTEKRKLSIGDICNIIMLLITIWALVKSYIPDQRIVHIESMLQQTVEAGNELIEIQSQQLEEEQKQTQLLEELVEDQNESSK